MTWLAFLNNLLISQLSVLAAPTFFFVFGVKWRTEVNKYVHFVLALYLRQLEHLIWVISHALNSWGRNVMPSRYQIYTLVIYWWQISSLMPISSVVSYSWDRERGGGRRITKLILHELYLLFWSDSCASLIAAGFIKTVRLIMHPNTTNSFHLKHH